MGGLDYIVPVLLCLWFATRGLGLPRVDPLVDTKVGLIKGLAASDGEYSMFLGIPYATVDLLNPFGPSIPHTGFDDTFEAIDDSAVCPQREEFNKTLVGTLDCLNLNIFVPSTASSRNRRPVLVWIHGGGFNIGFGTRFSQGPKYLVRHDVIVVTMNYRLGAYGFLCPDIPEVPGNQGFKDQLTALRWIKNNIEAFGGDSDKITIFGESAGGASVDLHLMFAEENLFHNVIMQSGTALIPFVMRDSDPNGPLELAQHLGFGTDNVYDALDFLRNVDTDLIVAATSEANVQVRACVEKEYDNVERFISEHPINVDIFKAKNIPILIGFNNNERGAEYEDYDDEGFKNYDHFYRIPDIFEFDSEYSDDMVANIRHFYIGDEDISVDVKQQIINYRSDYDYYHPIYRSIDKYFEGGASKIYHYIFSYDGGRNFAKRKNNSTDVSGAVHADELTYLFDLVLFDEEPTAEDQLIIDRMTTLWTNFAKYSDPTPEESNILPVQWPVVSKEVLPYLDINSELTVKTRPFNDRMAFWDLFFKLNWSYIKGTRKY